MILIPVAVLSSLFMAWTVGATCGSTSFGPVVSSRAMGILRSSLLAGISAFLGALFQGQKVTDSLSSGYVDGVGLGPVQAVLILLVSATMIAVGVWRHYPIPTAFTLVGATIGAGLGMGGTLDVPQVATVFAYWLALPFLAAGIGYFLSKILRASVSNKQSSRKILFPLLIIFGSYTSFTAGANSVGLAVGPLANAVELPIRWLLALGGLGIILGAWTGSPKIVHAVAREYADIGLRRSIAALIGTSLLAQGASLIGVPISFNAAILGGIIGSGLASKKGGLGLNKIRGTALSWVLAFSISFGIVFSMQYFIL